VGIPPGGLPTGASPVAPPTSRITINGVEYPCSEWHEIERGESLNRVWSEGFYDGIGESRVRSPRRCFVANYLDVTSPPYIRLAQSWTTISGATGLDTTLPVYHFRAQQPNGTNVIYFLNGDRRFKVNRDNNTIIEIIQVANVIYGRPALFNGSWRLARGQTVVSVTITVNNGAGTDVVTGMGVNARHFANIQAGGVSNIAMASATNQVSLSTDAVTFGGSFSVGDTSFGISDLLESQSELMVVKPDGPRRFDPNGNSLPVQRFTSANLQTSVYDGSNSHSHGPYTYWITASSMWRIFGDSMTQVGFESDPQYLSAGSGMDSIQSNPQWLSVYGYGRWLYASKGGQTFQAFIRDDGTLQWYGALLNEQSTAIERCIVDDGPALWVASGSSFFRMTLQLDGSTRASLGSARGPNLAGVTAYFRLGLDDFGVPDRQKQARRMWILLEATGGESYQLIIQRDGVTTDQNVGAAITSTDGLTERTFTVGTNDLFYTARFGYNVSNMGTLNDARVRAWGYEVHTPSIYQAKILLTPDSVRGYALGIQGSLQQLRTLQNAQRVAVKEPELDATRNGYILASRANVSWFHPGEKLVGAEGGRGVGYEVIVTIEFFDIPASVA